MVAGPLAITAWLIWSFITWVDDLVRPIIPAMYRPETYLPWKIPGSGLVIAFFALTMLGFLTANLVGRTLVAARRELLDRMPIVRPIYKTVKQVFTMLFSKSGTSFRKVGLVEFPAPGMWSLVFLSQPPSEDIASRLPDSDDQISVFMPCTPNPTTGFFFYLPRKNIIELDIPVEAAATLLVSAGMIQPSGGANGDQKKLAAMATAAQAARASPVQAFPRPACGQRVASTSAIRVMGHLLRGVPCPSPLPSPRKNRMTARLPRPDQADRFVAFEQIEQVAQRLSAFALRVSDRVRTAALRRRAPPTAVRMDTPCGRPESPASPLWRVPSTSPSPRSFKSSSAMRKPSSVSRMIARRAFAVSPSGAL